LTSVTATTADQALTWNDDGQLTQDAVTPAGATTAQDTNYIYDADGNLLLTADSASTTLYLDDEELTLSGGTVTGTRYYAIGDTTVATLTGASSVSYVVGDQQGTDSVAISGSTLTVTRRYYDPYGNPIGTTPSSFPAGEQGFVGGADDPATGLTNLGARELQPDTGSFISTDPILTPYNPQDLNAYAYAADNPATEADPTGLSATTTPHSGSGSNDCSAYALGSKKWLACEGVTYPKTTTMGYLYDDIDHACMTNDALGPETDSWTCSMYAENQIDLMGDTLTQYEHKTGQRCDAKAIVSYALAGGYLVGEAQDGVALTAEAMEGLAIAAEVAVSSILGGVFLAGLAIVLVASC
jgi:RHS repeat-associated protein